MISGTKNESSTCFAMSSSKPACIAHSGQTRAVRRRVRRRGDAPQECVEMEVRHSRMSASRAC
eukprot:362867-Chlamydomonas_euryale.AAC.6